MIIKLSGATFTKYIGTVDASGTVTKKKVTLTITTTPAGATVKINGTVRNSIEVDYGTSVTYEVSMDGYVTKSGSIVVMSTGSTMTQNITLRAVGSTEPEEPESPDTGGGSGETITGTLFLSNGALSVVSGENFYRTSETNTKRMNSSSTTEATGIYVENGYTITLTGVSGLRFDYVYANSAGPNSYDKTVNAIQGVGTASNFVASNYFPLNATGESNTITITNNLGKGYYYHFAIAAPNKTDVLTPSDYNITYKIEAVNEDTTKYTLIQGGINITANQSVYGNVLGSSDVNYNKRGHTEPAIFIKNGESVTISGLTGLLLDAVWYNSSTMNNANVVGSASNQVADNYFTLTDGTTDTHTYTNSTGSDYYYAFIVKNTANTNFTASSYTLTIK